MGNAFVDALHGTLSLAAAPFESWPREFFLATVFLGGFLALLGWRWLVPTGTGAPAEADAGDKGRPPSQGGGHLCFFNVEPAIPRGVEYKSNGVEPLEFETPAAKGICLVMHKPTADRVSMDAGCYPFSDHLHNRKRLWEIRIQLRLKRDLAGSEVYVGLEQDKYYYRGFIQHQTGLLIINALRKVCSGLSWAIGDDPKKTKGEIERPSIMFPISALDQLIETPEGEQPPSLSDPDFPNMGLVKAQGRWEFSRVARAMKLRPGPTFTFSLWGPAQFIDGITWKASGKDMTNFGIHPPCFFAIYTLRPPPDGSDEKRHLDSRKDYLLHAAYWSSNLEPSPSRIEELRSPGAEDSLPGLAEAAGGQPRARSRACCF